MVYLLTVLELRRNCYGQNFLYCFVTQPSHKGMLWGWCSEWCVQECICFRDKSLKETCRWQQSERRESSQLPCSQERVVVHLSCFVWENGLLLRIVLFAPCPASWALVKRFSESGYIMGFKRGVVRTQKNIDCNSCFVSVKSLPWKQELRQIYECVIFNMSLG